MTAARKLNEKLLYSGDNGRVFCGRMPCAGMTAAATGRGLSGQKVARYHGNIPCEGCGRKNPAPALFSRSRFLSSGGF